LDFDDLYQVYQAQQQLSKKPAQAEQILQKEISRDVNRSYSGQGIGF
jgi:hypothetical protein